LSLEALRGTEIYFGVTQKWLKDNNITEDDVVMLRYNDSTANWDMLSTELLNENQISVYYVAHSPALGLFVISYNRTSINASMGASTNTSSNVSSNSIIPVNNIEPNKTSPHNESSKQKLSSKGIGSGSSSSLGLLSNKNNLNNTLNGMKGMMWIVWILFGTFVFIIVLLVIIRHYSTKHYENELILATNNEFKRADKELDKKVPKVSENLDAIGKEVSEKLRMESTKSINKPKSTTNSDNINKPTVKSKIKK
jgi:preprotein translocase subunit SecG